MTSSTTKSPTELCPVCVGDGQIEYEITKRQTFGRDIGYIDTEWDDCYQCEGVRRNRRSANSRLPIDEQGMNAA
jgi:hypothetical protein